MVAKKSVQMVVVLNIEHSSADIWYLGFVVEELFSLKLYHSMYPRVTQVVSRVWLISIILSKQETCYSVFFKHYKT